jgi:hypothetical protein
MRARHFVTTTILLLAAGAARGERLSVPVTGASLVEVRSGEARLLLTLDFPELEDYAVERAFLQGVPTSVLEEPLDVWVRASRSGSAVGHVLSRTSLRARSGTVCDVTGLIHAARGEAGIDGLVVALPDWRGEDLTETIAQALGAALAGGTLEIECRRLLRPPPRPGS